MNLSGKLGSKKIQRIAIFRALQLGDMLCAVPALRALRYAFHGAEITLLGLPWASSFAERFSNYLDAFMEFPGFPGFPEITPKIEALPSFLVDVQRQNFDLALQMHGSGFLSNSLVALFGSRITAGFYVPGHFCPDPDHFMVYPDNEPEVRRHLHLMEFLEIPLQGTQLEFPVLPGDWKAFQLIREEYGLEPGTYVCIHPGARSEDRRWPVEKFAAVADALAYLGYSIILTGTEGEISLAQSISARMQFPAVNLAGQTSLGCLAALLSVARLLISNDTGVSHLASALHIPSVILFTASDPNRWAPLDRNLHRVIQGGLKAGPAEVIKEAEVLLKQDFVYAKP